mgnify:CR=1 FL=1
MQVEQLTCSIGAEVSDIHLGDASRDKGLAEEIRALLLQHKVLFFRDQPLTPAQQAGFAARFGDLHIHPTYPSSPEQDEIIVLDTAVIDMRDNSGFPGMKILQFAFEGTNSYYLPHNYIANTVAYVGTHDNETARGWFEGTATPRQREQAALYTHQQADEPMADALNRTIAASVSAVPKADFVVMNPTHYAVALKYDEKTMSAPQVISRGTDLIAMKIRDVAKEHNVPVLQSPMLARALYAHAELDQAIPATLYTAVAQVLAYVYRLKAALRGEGRMPDSLVEPFVPPELDPLNRTTVQGAAV